jgi:hypothetical protein
LVDLTVDSSGGHLSAGQLTVTIPPGAVSSDADQLNVLLMDSSTAPGPAAGFQMGASAFLVTVTDSASGTQLAQLSTPLDLQYALIPSELDRVNGDVSRLELGTYTDGAWVALGCTAGGATLDCTVPHLSLFVLMIAPPASAALDGPLATGWFYQEANGFSGAGATGFAVVDDAQASLWTEFQRLGGSARLGYPISQRFTYGGYVTQAFQKLGLQWRPDLGQAVPVNIFDDLSARGSDAWLNQYRQVPPPGDQTADAGLVRDDVVSRHLGMLDPYPQLLQVYNADADPLTTFGLPMSIQSYAGLVSVRLERGMLQMWTTDQPWAAAGTVVIGNAGDIARDAGLWPAEALVASAAQPAPAAASGDGSDAQQGD